MRHCGPFLLLLLCCHTTAFAQPQWLYMHQFRPPSVPNKGNFSMLRDSRGFMWFGSTDGLHRFDGLQWRTFRPDGQAGSLIGSNIYSRIFEDAEGNLWFSTNEAVQCYRRKTGRFEPLLQADAGAVSLLTFEAPHYLWIQKDGGRGLFRYDLSQKKWEGKGSLRAVSMHLPCIGKDGAIDGFLSYTYSIRSTLSYQNTSGNLRLAIDSTLSIYDLFFESDTRAWVAAEEGLFQLELNGTPTLRPIDTQHGQWRGIGRQSDGTLWFLSATAGLWKRQHGRFEQVALRFAPLATVFSGAPYRLYIDPEDHLWLSYDGEGVAWGRLQASGIVTFDLSDALQETAAHIEPLAAVQGKFLIGTEKEGLLGWSPKTGVSKHGKAPVVFHMLALPNGQGALVSMPGQVFRLHANGQWQAMRLQTPDKRLLIASFYYFFKGKTPQTVYACGKQYLYKIQLLHDTTLVCTRVWQSEGPQDKLYVGACDRFGNCYLNINDLQLAFLPADPKAAPLQHPISRITGFAHDSIRPNTVWIASSAQGLFRFDSRSPANPPVWQLNERNGLPDQALKSLLCDARGCLWLGSGKGVLRYNPADSSLLHLNTADGLWENSMEWKAACLTDNGQLLFGNKKALNLIDPIRFSLPATPVHIHLAGIHVLDEEWQAPENIAELSNLLLPYDSNTLSFRFNGIDFGDPARVRLQYRLDGLDAPDRWVETAPNSMGFARYANLPANHYVFRVRAFGANGLPSSAPYHLDIDIAPPYYQTWWFRLLVALALALSLYAIYRYRLNAMRRKEEYKRRMIELELNALRAQLNPHFVSNNLVSINRFIRNNGVEKVRDYVATFARLMRNVLEGARKPMVSLTEELDMLHNYVEVESGRFPEPIRFEVEVAADIDADQAHLPGMLLQPFVENALVHGLAPRNGQGSVTLLVSQEGQRLRFEIRDNGVGRRGDAQQPPGKKSHGLDITRQRLHLYDLQHQTHSDFVVQDLLEADGSSAGTRVVLYLGLPKK